MHDVVFQPTYSESDMPYHTAGFQRESSMKGNNTVLVISAGPEQFSLAVSRLQFAGCSVLFADETSDGLRLAQDQLPGLIISELAMPNIDGLELCRRARQDERLSATPILLVGDLSEESSIVQDGLRCGASDYVIKQINQGDLFKRCSNLIGLKNDHTVFEETDDVFRTLIENISDIITILAADGTVLFESPSVERALGYKPEELMGQQAFDLVHPDDVGAVIEFFKNTLHSFSASLPIEYRFRHKDGSWKFFESIGKPFNDPQHGLVTVVTSRDTTERKTALEEKRQTDGRLRTIFESAAMGMALVSDTGHAIQSNPALQQMLGYSGEELRRMSFVEFTHPDDADADVQLLKETFAGKRENYQIEKRFVTRSGDLIWVRLTVSSIDRLSKDSRYVIAMVENITGQKTAQAALSESEERFRAQYEGLPIPTFTWRKEGDDFVFQGYNAAAEQLTNGTISRSIGVKASDLFSERPAMLEAFHKCFDEKITINHRGPYRFQATGDLKYLDSNVVFIKPDIVMIACRDITEQTQTERLLKESRERFELVSVATNDGLWDWDFAENSLWLNEEFYNLLGVRPGEVEAIKETWYAAIHPDDRRRVMKSVQDAITAGEKYWTDEYRMSSREGTELNILDRSYLVYDAEGQPVRMIGAVMDITDLRRTEQELRHHKQAYKSLIDSIEGIVWEASAETFEFSFVSKQAERLLGYPVERWIDEPTFWADHLHPDDREWVVNFCVSSTSKGENHEFDYRMIAADGRVVWLHDIVTIDASDKDNIRLRGVMVDITAGKEAETALANANERAISEYVKLLERLANLGQQLGSARDIKSIFRAIAAFAVDSVPCSGMLIFLYEEESRTRKAVHVWYNGDETDISELQSVPVGSGPAGQAIEHGEVIVVDDYLKSTGRSPRIYIGYDEDSRDPQSCIIAPMKVMGKVIGIVEVQSYESAAYTQEHATAMRMAANLTANAIENVRLFEAEQARAEQLRQSQRLESVGRLAGGIAHDFNNMLTAINGFSDLTLRKLPEGDPLRGNLEEIRKAGGRSAELTQQLLAFSRRQMMRPKVIDLNQVVTETGVMLERLIGEDVELTLALSEDIGSVQADPGQLTQVIMNLAVNSRDAMPGGGRLTIETSNQDLDEDYLADHAGMAAGSYVMLAVSDTGMGMSQEVQKHIFEPFFTTKPMGHGTGLGLATVYGIVKQSGGYIWAYSEVDQGAVIKVYLPRVDAAVDEAPAGNISTENLHGDETILLVEDEDLVRRLARKILETCGYNVIEAPDGTEAMEICKQPDQHIDLLLTDVVMPKMSGRQLVQNVADIRPDLKVLFMSGYTDDSIVRHGVIESGENFIQKPFVFSALAGKVRSVLDQGKAGPSGAVAASSNSKS